MKSKGFFPVLIACFSCLARTRAATGLPLANLWSIARASAAVRLTPWDGTFSSVVVKSP